MEGREGRVDRMRRRARVGGAAAFVLLFLAAGHARATFYFGDDIQISGNFSTQNLFRIQKGADTFSAFNFVQQRNTFRLQYEQDLVEQGQLFHRFAVPFVKTTSFFAYYRFVYDSIYDIAPGPFLEAQDGSKGGSIDGIPEDVRDAVKFENAIREIFLDVDLADLPVKLRIGRQQIVWGEAIGYRALDSVNALDLTWHAQQEAGLIGKANWDELRRTSWTIKLLANLPQMGPFTNMFLEVFDTPFDFNPAKVRLLPFPWSVSLRNPFRGGLAVDLATVGADTLGLPPVGEGALFIQPCFDPTGSSASNATADFSEASETGLCPTEGLQETRSIQGLYDRRDPTDVNQVGMRIGGVGPLAINFTLNYMYRRHLGADIPGTTVAKAQVGAVGARPQDFVTISPHTTVDPITGEATDTIGFLRVPLEFYFPYVHVTGVSGNYFSELAKAVFTAEVAWTHGVPIATLDPTGNGIRRGEHVLGAVNMDRPTWIRWLNRRSTWLIISQLNFLWLPGHEDIQVDDDGNFVDGDVGAPNSDLVPGAFRGSGAGVDGIDRVKEWEVLSLVAATTFYRGGTFAPLLVWVSDWANAPSMEFIVGIEYLPTPNILIAPTLRFFTNFGRNVDDPWGVGRFSQWDELGIRLTYQF